MKKLLKNKKGLSPVLWIWGGAAIAAGLGYLINSFKPAPTGIAAIPIWGWIAGGLFLLIILMKK